VDERFTFFAVSYVVSHINFLLTDCKDIMVHFFRFNLTSLKQYIIDYTAKNNYFKQTINSHFKTETLKLTETVSVNNCSPIVKNMINYLLRILT